MYEKPKVERLGSLRELTQQIKFLGAADGFFLANPDTPIGDRS